MHGTHLEILVKPSHAVRTVARIAVPEAMKMQHGILAEVAGTAVEVFAPTETQVSADDLLVEIGGSE